MEASSFPTSFPVARSRMSVVVGVAGLVACLGFAFLFLAVAAAAGYVAFGIMR